MGKAGEWVAAGVLLLAVLIAWDWVVSIENPPCQKIWHGQTYGCK